MDNRGDLVPNREDASLQKAIQLKAVLWFGTTLVRVPQEAHRTHASL